MKHLLSEMCCKILTSMTSEGGKNVYGSKASIV
jgi:hypothetical protein